MNIEYDLDLLKHEIKNPLLICNGYLDMIMNKKIETKRTYLEIIKQEINRTLQIVENVKSKKEIFDLTLLFEDIEETLKDLLKESYCLISYEDSEEIYLEGNYNGLKQAFINIIKNSLESKNKEILKINIKVTTLKNYYKITIEDNGMGMTKEEINHIYNEYYTTKKNGTGLGIPFIKRVIDNHHGKISYKSIKDFGTTVTIYLPK